MPREHPPKLFLGGDGFIWETLVPRHCSFLESGRENFAFDGSSDPSIVEEGVNVLYMFIRVCCPIVSSQWGWFFQTDRELGLYNLS